MRLAERLAFLALLLGIASSCGPSFQVVYEGDSRFEHCYALDENPNVLMQQKSDCWADWIAHYTYGQTRDRVEFAAVRYRAIMRAGALPTDEAIMGAAPGEGTGLSLAAPAPTNAFASPPSMMVEDAGGVPQVVPSATLPAPTASAPSSPPSEPTPALQPPGGACIDDCAEKWHSCWAECGSKACTVCDKAYRQCGRACLAAAGAR
jgi:hypothetical protein